MAPSVINEDYYLILEVDQTANLDLINKSYRRLALKLHPDRNHQQNTTEAFQRLGRAYETLKDESERRKYDLLYPSLKGQNGSCQSTQDTPTTPQAGTASESIQIAALQKSRQERLARWRSSKTILDNSIFETKRKIRRVAREFDDLNSTLAAQAAEEAQKKSWTAWLLSPMYKRAEDSDEVKAQKDRARQERTIERDIKERRLNALQAELKTTENSLRTSQAEIDTANMRDDAKIQYLQSKMLWEANRQKQARENAERDRKAQQMKQQQEQRQRQEREAAEAARQRRASELAAEQKRQEEEAKRWQEIIEQLQKQHRHPTNSRSTGREASHAYPAVCKHSGWWPKVEGRTACPECYDIWTYLLQCPGCSMKACPKCQAAVRPKRQRNTRGMGGASRPRFRAPSPDVGYDYFDL